MTEHFKECFRITDDKICEDFYPRCEIFRWGKKELTSFIEKYEPKETLYIINKIQLYKRTYLYMPTWRESRHNFILSAGFDFDLLNKIMTIKKQIFLIKVHPGVNLNLEEMSMYSNIIILDKKIDVYPILPFTDILITDYSSIYYDYLLLNDKHILLFPFDYEDYITYNRDLAFDYNKYTPGKRIYTFNDLLTYFRDDFSLDFVERNWICEQFWSTHSTNSVLYNKILLLNF
jgi:CDP-glycerol glycerophosphotransferase (TagB/SpsB family)